MTTRDMSSIARWVSVVAHPFVMIGVMVGVGARRGGASGNVAASVGIVALFVVVPIAVLMVRQVRRGAWANVDASNVWERPLLYAVGIAGVLALVCYLALRRPDSFLLRGSTIALVLLIACAATTRWVKVSLHVAAAAFTATALLLLGSPLGWVLAAVVPVLAWSRLALGRHKPRELALGILFGVLAGIAIHVA